MKRIVTAIALLAALAVTAVAVASTAKLSGTYTTKISGKGPNTASGGLDGSWKLVLKKGKYNVSLNGHAVVNGKYTIKASTISITDTGGSGKCAGTGKYKFTIKGSKLTFKKISDTKSCTDRSEVLAHTFTKSTGSLPPQGY